MPARTLRGMSDRAKHDHSTEQHVPSSSRRGFLAFVASIPGAAVIGCAVPTEGAARASETTGQAAQADTVCRLTTGDAEGPYYKRGAPVTNVLAGTGEPGDKLV